ncbi:MAG: zinc ribbon domain-containing protein [Bacteroidota bacterium]
MKTCPNCKTSMDDNFDVCWNCGYSLPEERVIEEKEYAESCPNCGITLDSNYQFCPNCQYLLKMNNSLFDPDDGKLKADCLRCHTPLIFNGNYKFHEGGPLQNFFEIVTNRQSYDTYFCPKCGKIEFYLPVKEGD